MSEPNAQSRGDNYVENPPYETEKDILKLTDLMDELAVVKGKFFDQEWVLDILKRRNVDNFHRVPHGNRKHFVTENQYCQAREFIGEYDGKVKLYGYELVPIK